MRTASAPSASVPPWLAALQSGLDDPDRAGRTVAVRPGVGGRPAAVLMLLSPDAVGPRLLFIERATTLRTHAGQIAFPGGAAETTDADLVATALREAHEETGLDPDGVEVLGSLPPAHVAVSGFDVTAVVAWETRPTDLSRLDPREVAAVHLVAVADLADPVIRARARHPSGYVGPAFVLGELVIWGLTAHLVSAVLDLGGWERPWDTAKIIEVPRRFLTDSRAGRAGPGGPDAH